MWRYNLERLKGSKPGSIIKVYDDVYYVDSIEDDGTLVCHTARGVGYSWNPDQIGNVYGRELTAIAKEDEHIVAEASKQAADSTA